MIRTVRTPQHEAGTLLDRRDARRFRKAFPAYIRTLPAVDRREWDFPGGGSEKKATTYGFPKSDWRLLIAPARWDTHYWSVLVSLSANAGSREFFDGMNTPLAEVYLPITELT
jgi:hypothetical protein